MESRGTGLRPNRPAGWERRPAVPMDQQSPQGPSQLRSAGVAQGVIPSQVVDVMAQAPGGFVTQHIAGRPGMAAERARPGDAGVLGGTGGLPGPKDGLSHTTGKPVVGQTNGRGTF